MKKNKEKVVPCKTVVRCNSGKKYEEVRIGDLVIREIPVNELNIAETNVRVIDREEDLEELAKNIREFGLIHPPLATSDGRVYAGGRRLLAYRKSGKVVMPVRILDISEKDQILVSLSENIHSKTPDIEELTGKIITLRNRFGMSQKEIAKKLGKHPGTISRYLAFERLPPEIKEKAKEASKKKTLGVKHGQALRKLLKTPFAEKLFGDKKGETFLFLELLNRDYVNSLAEQMNLNLPAWDQMGHVAIHPEFYKKLIIPLEEHVYTKMTKYAEKKRMTFTNLITEALWHYIKEFPVADIEPLDYDYSKDS